MSLFARNVLPDHRGRYCQLFVINKLNIRVDELSAPPEVTDTEEIVSRYGVYLEAVLWDASADMLSRLSTVENGLSMLSQVVEIFSVYRLFQTQTKPRFSLMHAQDVESVFNLRTTGVENIEPLATMAENVNITALYPADRRPNEMQLRFLYEANSGQAAAEQLAKPLDWAVTVAPFKQFQSEVTGVLDTLAKTDLGCQGKLGKGICKYIPPPFYPSDVCSASA